MLSSRLDPKMASCEKAALVLRLLESVGLKGKEDQYVGGPLPGGLQVRGLSGGEKRRLSLCCATITDPSILFLDEYVFIPEAITQSQYRSCDVFDVAEAR